MGNARHWPGYCGETVRYHSDYDLQVSANKLEMILGAGASRIRQLFSREKELISILRAYMARAKDFFAFSIASAAASAVLAILILIKKLPSHEAKEMDVQKATACPDLDSPKLVMRREALSE